MLKWQQYAFICSTRPHVSAMLVDYQDMNKIWILHKIPFTCFMYMLLVKQESNTGDPFHCVPEHNSCHRISWWKMQAFYDKAAIFRGTIKGTCYKWLYVNECVRTCVCVCVCWGSFMLRHCVIWWVLPFWSSTLPLSLGLKQELATSSQNIMELHDVMIQNACFNLINLGWQIAPMWRQ